MNLKIVCFKNRKNASYSQTAGGICIKLYKVTQFNVSYNNITARNCSSTRASISCISSILQTARASAVELGLLEACGFRHFNCLSNLYMTVKSSEVPNKKNKTLMFLFCRIRRRLQSIEETSTRSSGTRPIRPTMPPHDDEMIV